MEDVVHRINDAYPWLLQWNTGASCVEFLQRVCAEPEMRAQAYGLLSKHPPEHCYQMPNGAFVAVDVVAKPNGERFDVITSGDGHPQAGGATWQVIPPSQWRPSNTWVDIRNWPIYDSATPHPGPVEPALLGMSNFPLIRALKDYLDQTIPSLQLADQELGHDYERVFCDLEGFSHVPLGTMEPWFYMGIDIRQPQWPGDFRRMMDHLARRNKLAWLTMYGGINHVQMVNNDTLVKAIDSGPYWNMITMLEVANEPLTNHWTYNQVREIARDLASKVASRCRMTLGTPEGAHVDVHASHEAMQADFEQFYLPNIQGITDITVHIMRVLDSEWSDPYAYNFILPHLTKLNGEPFGPGASNGGDINDPILLANQYKRASGAGWSHHTFHPRWGIFHGRPADQYAASFPEKKLADHQHIIAILHALHQYRHGGLPDMPLKPQAQFTIEFEEINRFYGAPEGLQRPGGMVYDTTTPVPADTVAMTEWGYQLMAGATVDEIKAKIVQSDEWKTKHGQA